MVLLSNWSLACSCDETNSVKEELAISDAVFVGKIFSSTQVQIGNYLKNEFKIEILNLKKGHFSKDTISVYTGISSRDCGVEFEIGEDYIIYGVNSFGDIEFGKGENSIWTYSCLRTKRYNKSEIDEITNELK